MWKFREGCREGQKSRGKPSIDSHQTWSSPDRGTTPPGGKSPPTASLEAKGGSMPARAHLGQRQEAFAARLYSSQHPSTRQIMAGPAPQAIRLRQPWVSRRRPHTVERARSSVGLAFPGRIHLLPPQQELGVQEAKGQGRHCKGGGTCRGPESSMDRWIQRRGWLVRGRRRHLRARS